MEIDIRQSIGFKLGITNAYMKKGFAKIATENNINLTTEQWGILNTIKNNEGMTQTDVSLEAKKDKTTITRSIDILEKNGYVKRKNNPDDKRVLKLYLTNKALLDIETLMPDAKKLLTSTTEGLSKDDMKRLFSYLDVILNNMQNYIGK